MKFTTCLATLANLGAALSKPLSDPAQPSSPNPNHLFTNPPPDSSLPTTNKRRIPTAYESAVLGRRILALTPLATLSTVFPTTYAAPTEDADGLPHAILLEHRPANLGGVPVGMMDYIADCEDAGNPTILAIKIATSFKNVEAGSNISVSVSWTPPYPPEKRIKSSRWWWPWGGDEVQEYEPVPYSAANLPRFSLLGYLEPITEGIQDVQDCFVRTHPDAKYWLPGNRIHESGWVRLVVTHVYWVGGFGDRAYIGWIDVADWHNVTREEWEDVRLPGEKKGWSEWSFSGGEKDIFEL